MNEKNESDSSRKGCDGKDGGVFTDFIEKRMEAKEYKAPAGVDQDEIEGACPTEALN